MGDKVLPNDKCGPPNTPCSPGCKDAALNGVKNDPYNSCCDETSLQGLMKEACKKNGKLSADQMEDQINSFCSSETFLSVFEKYQVFDGNNVSPPGSSIFSIGLVAALGVVTGMGAMPLLHRLRFTNPSPPLLG